ncbi:MAG TPA: hypothetical protein VK858_04440 [Longimicrobiales bacterium]|nr:hypothetical protein [Longimicrobiales bacterium]
MFRVSRPAVLSLLLALPVPGLPQVPSELRSAEALAAKVEAAEGWPGPGQGVDVEVELPAVDAELTRVASYLELHPDDAFALVLSVRLGRIRDLLAFRDAYMAMFEDPGAAMPEPPPYERHLAILREVLTRDSTVADAHYWTARLLLEEASQRFAMAEEIAPDPVLMEEVGREALEHARLAVRFAPSRRDHREFLALLLVDRGDVSDAAEVLGHESTVGGLMHRLVLDLVTFAPPPDAVPDDVLESFVQMSVMMGAGASETPDLAAHLELRARAWSTEASMEAVTEFYGTSWPGVRFDPADGWNGAVMAVFVPMNGGWRPAVDPVELEDLDRWDAESLILIVLPPEGYAELCEGALLQGLPPEMLLPGDRVGLMLMNGRRPGSRP